MFNKLEQAIAEKYGGINGVIIKQRGETVYEKYYNGGGADSAAHVASVTKSVVSALFGIALGKDFEEALEREVSSFFPGQDCVSGVTLRHLLTMTAPYKCAVEPYEDFFRSGDWLRFALGILGGRLPAGEFRYSPIVGAHILSGVFKSITGRNMLGYARERLFGPIGVDVRRDIVLESEEDYFVKMAGTARGWVADAQGCNTAGWGLFLTARDMAAIGQLYLDGGKYDGKRIVPAEWIDQSTREHSRWTEAGLGYGYLWWVLDESARVYGAFGDGGNAIYINKSKRLTVAVSAEAVQNAPDSAELIAAYIEPLF